MASFTLTFSKIECRRCGAERQTRFPCPECGERHAITETDLHVQFRQRAVEAALLARVEPVDVPEIDAAGLLSGWKLVELPQRIFEVGAALADEDPEAADRFAQIGTELAEVDRWAKDAPRRRPMLALTEDVCAMIGALVDLYDTVVKALRADEIREAQRLRARIQRALDEAAAAAIHADLLRSRVEEVLDSDDPLGAWMALAIGGDPIQASERGREVFLDRTGFDCGTSAGFAALLYDVMVDTIADPRLFWRSVGDHVRFLRSYRAVLPITLTSDLFIERAGEVAHDLWWAARRAAVAPDPETAREEATELLEAGHLVVEQGLKLHLGVAGACCTRMSFADTQACDVSELVNVAESQAWPISPHLGDPDIRNAFAHRDYEVSDAGVSLSPRHRRRHGGPEVTLAIDEIQDRVLQFVEMAGALDLALLSVAEELELDGYVDLRGVQFLRTFLHALGWDEIDVSLRGDDVVMSATVPSSVPLRALAYVAQPLVDAARTAEVRLIRTDSGARASTRIPIEAYQRWASATDEFTKEIAFVRLCSVTYRDGVPLMDESQVSKFVLVRAAQTVAESGLSVAEMRQQLKAWRALAREVGAERANRLIGRAMHWRTLAGTDVPVDESEMDELFDVMRRGVPTPATDLI